MKIINLFSNKKPVISFEIFPPKPDASLETIYEQLYKFSALKPDYISVTYGAGGSQKGRTIEIASKIKNVHKIESMAHLTCVGHTIDEIDTMLSQLKASGIENVLALRGDFPSDQPGPHPVASFKYANELITHIKKVSDFCIGAAAYVEGHSDSKRLSEDLRHLKNKVDSGVDFLVTQLFFDNRLFYDFVEKARCIGITCPISAGIMPIFKADQIKSITAKSGCSIPAKLVLMMDKYSDSPDDLRKAGIEYASHQVRDLVENGIDGIHLYTMNRPKSTLEIIEGI